MAFYGDPHKSRSESIHRAANAAGAPAQNMGIDHRRLHVAVAYNFGYGTHVVAVLEQMGGEGFLLPRGSPLLGPRAAIRSGETLRRLREQYIPIPCVKPVDMQRR